MRAFGIIAMAGLLGVSLPALAQDGTVIEGPVRLVDADIVTIGETRIILWGVDAPEKRQFCEFPDGSAFNCFEPAWRQMELLAEAGDWSCTQQGEIDRFKNTYAICEVAGTNVNATMVGKGLAAAYLDQTEAFEADQDAAKAGKLGLWQDGVTFDDPWLFREAQTLGGYR